MLLECIEIGPKGAAATSSVIWLHGLGADGHDFESIVPLMQLPNARFILPHAERRPVTINNGFVMRAWYDILSLSFDGVRNHEGHIRSSQAQIEALIQREIERGVASENIVVVGFSQGGAMALHTGLRWKESLAGIVVLSAYLLLGEQLAEEATAQNARTPMLFCHGNQDPVVPVFMGKAAYEQVRAHEPEREIAWFDYPMPHAVCPEEIAEISRFLHRVIG